MCWKCEKVVVCEMDIRESDLPMLPYNEVKWRCIVPRCRGGSNARDYGIAPYYFDPCKRRYNETKGTWRGGWFDASEHFYLCSRHSKSWDRIVNAMKHRFSDSFFISKVVAKVKPRQKGRFI